MKLKRKIRSLCLSILICCLLIGSGLDMTVICHAKDGHVSLELADTDGYIGSHADHSHPATDDGLSSRDDSGDCCTDVPISTGRAIAPNKPYKSNIASSIEVASSSNGTADSTAHSLPLELVQPPPYFTPLASIVLLI